MSEWGDFIRHANTGDFLERKMSLTTEAQGRIEGVVNYVTVSGNQIRITWRTMEGKHIDAMSFAIDQDGTELLEYQDCVEIILRPTKTTIVIQRSKR